MEAKDIFEANSRSVKEMLSERGLGLYVPAYQRPYSWAKDKVAKLLEDTLHGFTDLLEEEESFTFLGTVITIHDINFTTVQPIVRPEVPAKVLTIIDGQQRLSTLLLLTIVLHDRIRQCHERMQKPFKKSGMPPAEQWLDGQARSRLSELEATFYEVQAYGDAPNYPRMIRAFSDQWSKKQDEAKYESPIAHLIGTYVAYYQGTAGEFRPRPRPGQIEGETALVERYQQIAKLVKALATGKKDADLEELPSIQDVLHRKPFQRALLNHELPDEVANSIRDGVATEDFLSLLRLVLFASYILNRVAVTVVRGKNEDYAFTIFESLNTTGEPLTAFETFRPRVVSAEGLAKYESSLARSYVDQVADYLAQFKVGDPLQNATRDLIVVFALAETGEKLSKRLTDQRKYLKEEFERYEQDAAERLGFVKFLKDTSTFVQYAWNDRSQAPHLHGLPNAASSDIVKLCLTFLYEVGHTVTLGALVRFYSRALAATAGAEQAAMVAEFEEALKAITAFSVLWRAANRGTANIDNEYREIMAGSKLTSMPALARKLDRKASADAPAPIVDLQLLKQELRSRLSDVNHGNIASKADWIRQSALIPAYANSRVVSRFLLLAAHHDAVEDTVDLGLVTAGKLDAASCLTYVAWQDEKHLSLEHIAPQQSAGSWDQKFNDDKETVHRLGNLVLVPADANASLSNRPWSEKSVLYAALGATTRDKAKQVLDLADANGISFAQSTKELVELSAHMPHLASVGQYPSQWTADAADIRGTRLLTLAWNRLYAWLQ